MSDSRTGRYHKVLELSHEENKNTYLICACMNRAYGVRQKSLTINESSLATAANYFSHSHFASGIHFYWAERDAMLASEPTGKHNVQSPLGNDASVQVKSTDKKMRLITLRLGAPFLQTGPWNRFRLRWSQAYLGNRSPL